MRRFLAACDVSVLRIGTPVPGTIVLFLVRVYRYSKEVASLKEDGAISSQNICVFAKRKHLALNLIGKSFEHLGRLSYALRLWLNAGKIAATASDERAFLAF